MIVGRNDDADRVVRNEAPVLVVTGDSGIGKSTVLKLSCGQVTERASAVELATHSRDLCAG
jgi:ABC-type transporter Mla maintaining outer membrane lipid asymmetry ATPase subunit MlaF